MSQCITRKRWLKVAIVALFGIVFLTGCGVSNEKKSIPQPQSVVKNKNESQILQPWSIITGGKLPFSGSASKIASVFVGSDDPISIKQPVAVGGYGNFLYIVDADGPLVFRYNRVTQSVEPLGNVGTQFVGTPMGIFVQSDLSFYVADPDGKAVLYFNQKGQFVRKFYDDKNLSRPIDVVVDVKTENVLIADGSFSHVVVFNKVASPLYIIGRRGNGPGRFRAITALASTKNSVYIADRIELPVQELELNGSNAGKFRYTFGSGQIIWPTAIVVDAYNRVFVSDKSDNTIKIYSDINMLEKYGGSGKEHGKFRIISDMWMADDGLLYVADSLNRRVQVFRIIPDAKVRQFDSGFSPLP